MTRALAEKLWRFVDAACFTLALLLFLACIFAPQLWVLYIGV